MKRRFFYMKCPNCGELIKEKKKMNFCGFCGANLKTGEKTFTQPEPEENFVPNSTPVQNLSDFNPGKSSAAVNTPPINPNFASPFEQMKQFSLGTPVSIALSAWSFNILYSP